MAANNRACPPLLGYRVASTDREISIWWIQQKLNRIYPDQHIAEDNQMGNATLNLIKRFQKDHGLVPDGVIGPLTMEALMKADPWKDKKILVEHSNWYIEYYKNTIPQLVTNIINIFAGMSGAIWEDVIDSKIDANSRIIQHLKNASSQFAKLYDSCLKNAKTAMAEYRQVKIVNEGVKNNILYRKLLGFSTFKERLNDIVIQQKSSWDKIQKTIHSACINYGLKNKATNLLSKYTNNGRILATTKNIVSKAPNCLSFTMAAVPLIWTLIHHEDTEEWERRMHKDLYSFLDQLLALAIVTLIPVVIAFLVAAGIISAPVDGVIVVICFVVSIILGIIFWILEDRGIYLSEYIEDFGYNTTYKLLYN